MKDIIITDNEGLTFDRYLVYTHPNKEKTMYHECYSMSHNPLWPRGVNLWAGQLPAPDPKSEEKQIPFEELPPQVREAIRIRLTYG